MPRVPHSTDDLEEAEVLLQRAMLHADADALELLLDDEIVITGADGLPRDKDAEIESYRSGARRVFGFEVERFRVRVIEELGLTFVTATLTGEVAGEPFAVRERHTRTWRLGDEWILVASHATPVKD